MDTNDCWYRKMNTAIGGVREVHTGLHAIANVKQMVCPPFVSLAAAKELIKGNSINSVPKNRV